ncbi:MAG: hypothetical protein N4J56_007014 [Chroococcidiopsis sp. SAG 2025]|nr:hypothetical protein [Chroococcidiopsis sp. SAG 2025]
MLQTLRASFVISSKNQEERYQAQTIISTVGFLLVLDKLFTNMVLSRKWSSKVTGQFGLRSEGTDPAVELS